MMEAQDLLVLGVRGSRWFGSRRHVGDKMPAGSKWGAMEGERGSTNVKVRRVSSKFCMSRGCQVGWLRRQMLGVEDQSEREDRSEHLSWVSRDQASREARLDAGALLLICRPPINQAGEITPPATQEELLHYFASVRKSHENSENPIHDSEVRSILSSRPKPRRKRSKQPVNRPAGTLLNMAPTEESILANYLLIPAQLPTIISLKEFTELFPRAQQSSPQVKRLYRDLQHQRNALVDAVESNIETEAKRAKALRREILRAKREAEEHEIDDEIDIERAVGYSPPPARPSPSRRSDL